MTVLPPKALAAIDVIPGVPVPNETDFKKGLLAKALTPIVVRPGGILTLVKDLASLLLKNAL